MILTDHDKLVLIECYLDFGLDNFYNESAWNSLGSPSKFYSDENSIDVFINWSENIFPNFSYAIYSLQDCINLAVAMELE